MRKLTIALIVLLLLFSQVIAQSNDDIYTAVLQVLKEAQIGEFVRIGSSIIEKPRLKETRLDDDILVVSLNSNVIDSDAKAYSLPLSPKIRMSAKESVATFIKDLFEIAPEINEVRVEIWLPIYIDEFGNVDDVLAGELSMDKQTYTKINWKMASLQIVANLLQENWDSQQSDNDPKRIYKEMFSHCWSGNVNEAINHWHPGVYGEILTELLESDAQVALEYGPDLFLFYLELMDLEVYPIGYDRYIIWPTVNGRHLNLDLRLMVHRYAGTYVVLLPGMAFNETGAINSFGKIMFNSVDRPDPNISYRNAILAILDKDFATLRSYTTKYVSDDYIRRTIEEFSYSEEDHTVQTLKQFTEISSYPVILIDPYTVILSKSEEEQIVMRWEDGIWKIFPQEALEIVYEDYSEGL